MPRVAYPIAAFIALAVAYLLWKPLLDRQPITPAISPTFASYKAACASQLNRTMPQINFTGQELSDVFDFFRDISGSNIFVDWRAIEAAGVKKSTPIHVRIKGMSFSQGVNLVLSHAGKPSTPLLFRIDDLGSGFEVTTQAQLDHGVNVQTHNVVSLLRQEQDPFKLAFGYSPLHQSATVPEQRFANIQERIRSRYGKESVLDNEVYLNRSGQPHSGWDLIVPQTKEQHEEIDKELAYLAWIPRAQAFALRAGTIVLGALIAVRISRMPAKRRLRARLRQGLCKNCGYDLRASPQRCPECGLAALNTARERAG